jgi:hypothetical protein
VEALHEAVGSLPFATTAAWVHDPYVKAARESLDAHTFEVAWAEGRAMTLPQALEYAVAELSHDHIRHDSVRPPRAE